MTRARLITAAALVLLVAGVSGPAQAGHSSWGCEETFTATTTPRALDCTLFLTGVPTAVKGVVSSGTGSLNVSLTIDPVTGVRGPAVAECAATRSASCEDTMGIGSRVILPGALANTLLLHCHVDIPAGVAGSYVCTSGYSL